MNVLADDTGPSRRLMLALLLALSLHVALFLGMPVDWRLLRFPKPLRFDVVLLPAEKPNISALSAAPAPAVSLDGAAPLPPASEPAESMTASPLSTTAGSESSAPPPESAPSATPVAEPATPAPVMSVAPEAPFIPPPSPPAPAPVESAIPPPSPPAPATPTVTPKLALEHPPAHTPALVKPSTVVKTTPPSRPAIKPNPALRTPVKPAKPPVTLPKLSATPAKPAASLPKPAAAAESPVKPHVARPSPAKSALSENPQPAITEPAFVDSRPAHSGRRNGNAGADKPGRLDSVALLSQVANFETESQRKATASVRSKRVNLADTRSAAGFYAANWAQKVTRAGEMNFPDAARRLNLSAGPFLEVAIRADGGLQEVSIRRSSGNAELDQAAQRIVRLAAPYPPFPPELRQQYDVLRIEAPWRFDPGGQLQVR